VDHTWSLDSPHGDAQVNLLVSSLQNKQQKGWGILCDVFAGSTREFSAASLDNGGILKKSLMEGVEFEQLDNIARV
jgi:hypothetical protein